MFYSGIHALRAFAALLVVLHHAFHRANSLNLTDFQFEFGAWGVDLFFVISGFVMAKGVEGQRGWRDASSFIGRRLARVVPLYWTATLLLAAVYFAVPQMFSSYFIVPLDLLQSLFFLPYEDARGYVRPVVSQGWTLIFEMFFYVLVSLGLLFGRGHAMRLAAGLIGVLISFGYLAGRSGLPVPFLLSGILVEFLLGVAIYQVAVHAPKMGNLTRIVLAIAGVLFSYLLTDLLSLGVERGLAGGLGAMAVVYAAVGWRTPRLPSVLRLLGDASYAIYLFHGIGFSLTVKLLVINRWQPSIALFALMLGGTLFGVAVHLVLERRLQRIAVSALNRIGIVA